MICEQRQGMLILVSGPSGTGKGTLCERLIHQETSIIFSVSVTTRKPREGEIDGVHYRFITEGEFDELLRRKELLEYATVHEHRYGTPKKPVEEACARGLDILLDIDSQGAMNVMRTRPDCVSIFILPPSYASLRQRLKTRNTDNEEEIRKRLINARSEIEKMKYYDYALVNDDLDLAFQKLQCIISAEHHKTKRYLPQVSEK